MSKFNLQLEYPEINYNEYKKNTDGTPKCPLYWLMDEETEFERYKEREGGFYTLQLNQNESTYIPFTSNDIDRIETREFTFNHLSYYDTTELSYTIRIHFSDSYYQDLFVPQTGEYTFTIDIPSNSDYIRIEPLMDSNIHVLFFTDFIINIKTSNYKIITENANTEVVFYTNKGTTANNQISVSTVKNREVFYTSELIVDWEDEQEINAINDLCRKNRLLLLVNIDISDLAGFNLAGIPYGSSDNWVKYYHVNHSTGQRSGIYSYITMKYKNDRNNNANFI